MKIDLIIQGPFTNYSKEIVEHYQKLPWVRQIIISCWRDNLDYEIPGAKMVKSLPLSNNGIGNRNAHIITSYRGLLEVKTNFCAKLRSDQKISLDSMNLMYDYMLKHQDKVCVMGFYEPFPFHPRDHSFWGKTSKVISVFDIPLDPNMWNGSAPYDSWPYAGFYANHVRAECYIASQYLAKKCPKVKKMTEFPQQYLCDFSDRWEEAKTLSEELMDKYFIPFPKIDFEWPKHGMTNYHYEWARANYGEFWGDL